MVSEGKQDITLSGSKSLGEGICLCVKVPLDFSLSVNNQASASPSKARGELMPEFPVAISGHTQVSEAEIPLPAAAGMPASLLRPDG